jgi:hypothetical protein
MAIGIGFSKTPDCDSDPDIDFELKNPPHRQRSQRNPT